MTIQAFDPSTGRTTGFTIAETHVEVVQTICTRAVDATRDVRFADHALRAGLLRSIASDLEASADNLVAVADRETALGDARLRERSGARSGS